MENASKALIMAGGVLISLLVIGLLVFFYNNIQGWQQTDQGVDEIQQAVEFNKQYDVYDREVYGSELLSIANKVNDYNKREANSKGYKELELQVIIRKNIGGNNTEYFKVNNNGYSANELELEVTKLQNRINDDIGKKEVKGIKISKLATMRHEEIENLELTNKEYEDYSKYTSEYNTLRNLLVTVKSTVFKNIEFKYDEQTGRIVKMIYRH